MWTHNVLLLLLLLFRVQSQCTDILLIIVYFPLFPAAVAQRQGHCLARRVGILNFHLVLELGRVVGQNLNS